ncbi:MAG: prolyl oligopeptidase family serine peptidase [Verrucomicrobia bacterium]|jgi:cephalosporin-C deacetylase|nr:prolyl oligopeptidase family serine peptidase [Verrucomicrobiota bacterium]
MASESFWEQTIAETRAEALAPTCEAAPDHEIYRTFRVTYRSLGGVRVTAKLAVPTVQPGTRLPAIVTAPGYGGWQQGVSLAECQRGYLVLQVFPRGQGESQDAPSGDTGVEYLLRGLDAPEHYFYRGAFMDLLRGVDYLCTRDDIDHTRMGMMGTSQGGALVLSSAALEPRIRAVVAHLPFLCDVANNTAFADSKLSTPEAQRTYASFDPVSLASCLHAPTLLSSGGRDTACPPETIQAVLDRLPGKKALYHDPELTHTSSRDFYHMAWAWMDRHLDQIR